MQYDPSNKSSVYSRGSAGMAAFSRNSGGPFIDPSDASGRIMNWANLVGGLSAATIAALVNNGLDMGQLLPGVADALLTVGAPTCVGLTAVNVLDTSGSSVLVKSLLAGTFAVATMIAVGALPAVVDVQTLALIGICSGGAAVSVLIVG